MKVMLPALFIRPVFKVDRSVKLEFETRELLGPEVAKLTDMRQSEGWLLFAANELQEQDIPEERADPQLNQKSQAQRLRAVLFLLWKRQGEKGDFDDFYKSRLERMIDNVKAVLD